MNNAQKHLLRAEINGAELSFLNKKKHTHTPYVQWQKIYGIRSAEEFIRKSPHEYLAHISEDVCELILKASGSFDSTRFVRLGARWPHLDSNIGDADWAWMEPSPQSLSRLYIILKFGKKKKTPIVIALMWLLRSLFEEKLHRRWDRITLDESKHTRWHCCSHELHVWVHCEKAPVQVQMIRLVSAKERIATRLSPKHWWMPTLTHAHAGTKHMTCSRL